MHGLAGRINNQIIMQTQINGMPILVFMMKKMKVTNSLQKSFIKYCLLNIALYYQLCFF
jgi:hypothetical protein